MGIQATMGSKWIIRSTGFSTPEGCNGIVGVTTPVYEKQYPTRQFWIRINDVPTYTGDMLAPAGTQRLGLVNEVKSMFRYDG